MFNDGSAVKGIFLLNKNVSRLSFMSQNQIFELILKLLPIWQLPPQTVQVRPSMIKVYKDKNLSNFSTFNSLEVVTTRYMSLGFMLS